MKKMISLVLLVGISTLHTYAMQLEKNKDKAVPVNQPIPVFITTTQREKYKIKMREIDRKKDRKNKDVRLGKL